MVDFSESDKMMKISGKVVKSNTYNGFSSNVSFFFFFFKEELLQIKIFSEFFYIKFLVLNSSLNKERNITTKPIVSVWFIHFSTHL